MIWDMTYTYRLFSYIGFYDLYDATYIGHIQSLENITMIWDMTYTAWNIHMKPEFTTLGWSSEHRRTQSGPCLSPSQFRVSSKHLQVLVAPATDLRPSNPGPSKWDVRNTSKPRLSRRDGELRRRVGWTPKSRKRTPHLN